MLARALFVAALTLWGTSPDGNAAAPPSLRPLHGQILAHGDIIVRIHYVGSIGLYSTWLTLQRIGNLSQVQYFIEDAAETIPHPEDLIPATTWDAIWVRLANERFFDMPGNQGVSNCSEAVPLDAETVEVEVLRGKNYRSYAYNAPMIVQCSQGAQFAMTLRFLQDAFGHELPMP